MLCTNQKRCCLPLHMAVRLTPAIDSVQVWNSYSCYVIVDSVWSEVVFVRCVTKMDWQKFEQCCAIKFCVNLGEFATVTYEKLQRAYGEHFLSRTQVFRWHKSFLEGREQVEDEPRAGKSSTSKMDDNVERVRSLVRSDRLVTLRMISSELNLNRFKVHQILTRDLDMRKVLQDGSKEPRDWAEGQSEECLSWSNVLPWEGARNLQSCFHRWWIMDLGVRPRDKTPKSGVAHCKLSPSQESENEQIQNQIDAHLFFWQSGDRPQGICATRTNCQSNFLSRSPWKTQAKGGMCATRHTLGCCTTAMPHVTRQSPSMNFWQKKAFLWFLTPPIRRISVPVTSFYSPGSKTTWKGAILVLWIISRKA